MKPDTLRRRARSMAERLQRELAALGRIFPCTDWNSQTDPASEAMRNLGTAIAELQAIPSMSEHGLRELIAAHAPAKQENADE